MAELHQQSRVTVAELHPEGESQLSQDNTQEKFFQTCFEVASQAAVFLNQQPVLSQPENNLEKKFLEACEKAALLEEVFQREQATLNQKEDKEKNVVKSFPELLIQNQPSAVDFFSTLVDQNPLEVALGTTIRANRAIDFKADYETDEKHSVWLWDPSTKKTLSAEVLKIALNRASLYSNQKQPLILLPQQTLSTVSVGVGNLGFPLERTLSDRLLQEWGESTQYEDSRNVMLLSDITHLETASDISKMFTVGLPQTSLAGGASLGGGPALPRNPAVQPPTAAPARQLPQSSIRAQAGRQQQGSDQSGPSGLGQLRQQQRQNYEKNLNVSQPQAPSAKPVAGAPPISQSLPQSVVPRTESISAEGFQEIVGLYDNQIVRKDGPDEILANSKNVTDLKATLKKCKNIRKSLITPANLANAIELDEFVTNMISDVLKRDLQDLVELRYELMRQRILQTLNRVITGDRRTLAGKIGNFSTLNNLQDHLKRKYGKKDFNPSSKLHKDHVETQEWREIFLQIFLETIDSGQSIFLEGFLNIMRTSSEVCTRYKSYAEVGSIEESRSIIAAATLHNDPFKFSLVCHYSLESAKNITRNFFVQHRYQVLSGIEQHEDWKSIPKHISLPLYELTIGLLRFGKNFLNRSHVVDPISRTDIPNMLIERKDAISNFTIWVELFQSYLKASNPLHPNEKEALKAILTPYLKRVDAVITDLLNKTNATASVRDAGRNRTLHPSIQPLLAFKESWGKLSESLLQVISLQPSECFDNKQLAYYHLNELDTQSKNMGLHKDAYPFQQEALSGTSLGDESVNTQKNMTQNRRVGLFRRLANFFSIIMNSFNFFKI